MNTGPQKSGILLRFSQGSLIAGEHLEQDAVSRLASLSDFVFDKRTQEYRARASSYRNFIIQATKEHMLVEDQARAYQDIDCTLQLSIKPRAHQQEALGAWIQAGKRGVVCLPTGAGKTILALLAMEKVHRSTLVVVPTIDLLWQWQKILATHFKQTIGLMGGGQKDLQPITVATYDSARLIIESHGNKFGFLIVDECHHLPAPQYQIIASAALAPFRLGLSATLERVDGKETLIYELLGEKVYEGSIKELVANTLAPYDVISIEVELTAEEKEKYTKARSKYTHFIRKSGIDFSKPDGWKQFIMRSSRSSEGKEAMQAFREQKKLAQAAQAKLDEVWNIINAHSEEPIIIFTDDNEMAYQIGSLFVLAVLTHKTKPKERQKMLNAFRSGDLSILVTSKVLNEGVDVPEASVGIVVSGSGTVREHVQRLGRILRHKQGKRAVLYEVIAKNTSEKYVNERRRQHLAYQEPS